MCNARVLLSIPVCKHSEDACWYHHIFINTVFINSVAYRLIWRKLYTGVVPFATNSHTCDDNLVIMRCVSNDEHDVTDLLFYASNTLESIW